MIGFANADGGRLAIGIHSGRIEGVNSDTRHLNALLQASIDFAHPPVRHAVAYVDCVDAHDQPNRVLVLDIEASEQIHRNKKNECFLRVGDENRRLGPTEERELAFDKGESIFDGTIVPDLTIEDLDAEAIDKFKQKVGSTDTAALLRSRGLYHDTANRKGVTQAGWLLFGRTLPVWSYVRFLQYRGTIVETGTRSNLTEDIRIEGSIPHIIDTARDLVFSKLGTVIRQVPGGRFERLPLLPEFAWLEAIVNAVTHRSYSLQGDGIRVTLFDDRLEVESPGRLPGLVRVQNIQNARYSRNPHIARVLAEMTGYVRELNEGVRRMFEEMRGHGLQEPVYGSNGTSVKVVLYTRATTAMTSDNEEISAFVIYMKDMLGAERVDAFLSSFASSKMLSTKDAAKLMHVSAPTARKYLMELKTRGLVTEDQSAPRDPRFVWRTSNDEFWTSGFIALLKRT
jgi:ATP-dependent DNA helicase RecG